MPGQGKDPQFFNRGTTALINIENKEEIFHNLIFQNTRCQFFLFQNRIIISVHFATNFFQWWFLKVLNEPI